MSNELDKNPIGPGLQLPLMLGYVVSPAGAHGQTWCKIGSALAHNDGFGYDIQMDALPVDGRLVLRTVSDTVQPDNERVMAEQA